MPMAVVEAAFQARYVAFTGDSPPSIPAIIAGMPSPTQEAFVVLQFPVVNGSQPVLQRHFFEEGAARFVLNVRRSFEMYAALSIADNIAQIFRRRKFDGIETFTPSAPIINEASNDGNWFSLSVIVPYRYQFDDEDPELEPDERPDWVPADAVIHIDLVGGSPQGRAWTLADGEVAVDTLLGADPNSSNSWDTTGYNGADLAANGYVSQTAVALIGSALAKVVAGVTMSIRFNPNNNTTPSFLVFASANGNAAVEADLNAHQLFYAEVSSWAGSLNETTDPVLNHGSGPSVINVIALTLTGSRCEVAINGSLVVTGVLVPGVDFPAGSELGVAIVDADNVEAIQSITLYDALPDTTGLSALSQPDLS